MENQELSLKLKDLIILIIQEEGLDLVEFIFLHHGKKNILKVLVDWPEGGISLNECANVNQKIDKVIEDSGLLGQDYILEVSSPGLDRPLKTRKDFLRTIGKEVRFFLRESINKKKELVGTINKIERNLIFIEKNNRLISIPLEKITKAIQVII